MKSFMCKHLCHYIRESKKGEGIRVRMLLLFSCQVTSDSLQPHGLQHTGLPCPSPSSRVCSNLCPLNQWCHPAISSSVIPFSSCLQSFSASGSFPVNQLFTSGGQSIGVSASASVLPMNIVLISFRMDRFDLLAVQVTLKNLLQHHSLKVSVIWSSAFFMDQLSHTGKTIALTYMDLCWQSDVSAFLICCLGLS